MAELTAPARELIQRASALADEMGHPLFGSEHILLAMVEADEGLAAQRILRETGSISAVEKRLLEVFGRSQQ